MCEWPVSAGSITALFKNQTIKNRLMWFIHHQFIVAISKTAELEDSASLALIVHYSMSL